MQRALLVLATAALFVLLATPTLCSKPQNLLIVATGAQIKLYPVGSEQEELGLDSNNFYVLKPNLSLTSQHHDLASSSASNNERRRSILPPNVSLNDNNDEPLITELDYFFNEDYCENSKADNLGLDCLVVVWYDTGSKVVRFGSTLLTSVLNNGSKILTDDNRVLWLDMFPDIKLNQYFGCRNAIVKGITIDRDRASLYVLARADDASWRLLSNEFLSNRSSLFDNRCDSIDLFCSSWTESSVIKSLNVDQEHSLFLLQQFNDGARLGSIKLDNRFDFNECHIKTFGHRFNQSSKNDNHTVIAMTMLEDQSGFLWLTDNNELYETTLDGLQTSLVARLAPRPTISSVYAMQALHGTLFISDSMKKSLVTFAFRNQSKEDKASPSNTHQVLLVELSGLFSFKLIDLNKEVYMRQKDVRQLFFVQVVFLLFIAGLFWARKKPNSKDTPNDEMEGQKVGEIYPSLAYEKLADGQLPA